MKGYVVQRDNRYYAVICLTRRLRPPSFAKRF